MLIVESWGVILVIIAFANLKGGVGKTTLAVNVAGALASSRRSAVLVDADPQGTAVEWGRAGRLPFEVVPLPVDDGPRSWINAVARIEADLIVVDLPPMLGEATAAAMALADVAAIPVTPSGADLRATARAVDLVQRARDARESQKPRAVLIPSKVDRRTAAGAEIEAVLHDFGEAVAPAVSQRIAHVDAFTAGQTVADYAATSAGASEIKAVAAVLWRLAQKGN